MIDSYMKFYGLESTKIPYKDITFCSRECLNMGCVRNQKNLPQDVKYISICNFEDCSEWRGNIFNLSEEEAKKVFKNFVYNTDRDTLIKELKDCGLEIEE